jgi:hypothetical protein
MVHRPSLLASLALDQSSEKFLIAGFTSINFSKAILEKIAHFLGVP